MPIGPVQLLVLGFNDPGFTGTIVEEVERLRENSAVRVIDSLAVFKDAAGELEVQLLSEPGTLVGALVGLVVEGEEDLAFSADIAGAPPPEEDGWDVVQDIPNDTAAALLLIEHRWVVPLREAIVRAGGFRISDGFISPLDLVEIGLVTAEEADALLAIETGVS